MQLSLDNFEALLFLPPMTIISIWVIWQNSKFGRIPNKAIAALGIIFFSTAPFFMPFEILTLRVAQMAVLFAGGFILSTLGFLGGGAAKLISVIALYVLMSDIVAFSTIFFTVLILSYLILIILRQNRVVRGKLLGWSVWKTSQLSIPFTILPLCVAMYQWLNLIVE